MKYKVNVGISYQAEGEPMEMYEPGEFAVLDGWPVDDVERFEAMGIIERVDEPAPVEPQKPRKVLPTARE